MLVLIAALAAPVRQACGTTCVEGNAEPAPVSANAAGACHKPEAAPSPVTPEPDADHCTHDHSSSVRPSVRGALADTVTQPALFDARPEFDAAIVATVAPPLSNDLSPGSPPLRIITLRI